MSPKFGCGADVVISALSASFWAFPLACWAFDFGFGGFHFGFLSLPLPRVYFTIGLKLGASGFPDSCPERRPSATTRQAPRTRKTARIFFWFFGPSFPFIGLLAFNYFHVGLLAFNFLSFWPFGPSKKKLTTATSTELPSCSACLPSSVAARMSSFRPCRLPFGPFLQHAGPSISVLGVFTLGFWAFHSQGSTSLLGSSLVLLASLTLALSDALPPQRGKHHGREKLRVFSFGSLDRHFLS